MNKVEFDTKMGLSLIQEICEQRDNQANHELDSNLIELHLTNEEIEFIIDSIGLRSDYESLDEEKLHLLRKFIDGRVNIFEYSEVKNEQS